MAFVFPPNPDAGAKETNPETGVEYIYIDGAWRPLGPEVTTDLTELDGRYLQLTGGHLTGSLTSDGSAEFSGDIKIEGSTTAGSAEISGDVKIEGSATIEGNLQTDGTARFVDRVTLARVRTGNQDGFTLEGTTSDSSNNKLLAVFHNNGSAIDAVNYMGKTTNSANIQTKTSVEAMIDKAIAESALAPKPAQMVWKWGGESNDVYTPADGYFYKQREYLRFSFNTSNSVSLGDGKFSDTNKGSSYGPFIAIWEYITSNGKWKLKARVRQEALRWNYKPSGETSSHIEVEVTSAIGYDWNTFVEGKEYYIRIDGLC